MAGQTLHLDDKGPDEDADAAVAVRSVGQYGNFVYDSAVMGAELYRTLYTQDDATDMAIQRAKVLAMVGDLSGLLADQGPSIAKTEAITENGRTIRFETSRTFRVGELTSTTGCDIGETTMPQVRHHEPPTRRPAVLSARDRSVL